MSAPPPPPPKPGLGTPFELRKKWLKDRPTADEGQAVQTAVEAPAPQSPSAPQLSQADKAEEDEITWDAEHLDNLSTAVDTLRLRTNGHDKIIREINNQLSKLLGQDAPHQSRLKAHIYYMSQTSRPESMNAIAVATEPESHNIATPTTDAPAGRAHDSCSFQAWTCSATFPSVRPRASGHQHQPSPPQSACRHCMC